MIDSITRDGESRAESLVIIGSGPAGYTAAIYAARAGLKPVVIAGAEDPGGALMTTNDVENYPGFSAGIEGPVLMEEMRAQAERFGARFLYESVEAVDLEGPVKAITTSMSESIRAHAVVLAMGSAYRRLEVEGEDRFSGLGVSWCATCDGYPYSGKDVIVVGGGDTAVEESLFLGRLGARVTLVHRGDRLRASSIMQERVLADPSVEINWNSKVEQFQGSTALSEVVLTDTSSGSSRNLPISGAFIAIGHDPRSDLVRGQVDRDADGYVLVQHPSTATNLPGVFACGDLVDRSYRQAITAAGTGCASALDAERYLAGL